MRRRHVLLTALALAMPTTLHGQADPKCRVQPISLRAMRDCYRPVLVFAPNAGDRSLAAQQALLEQYADDMMDRNLLYVPILARGAGFEQPLDAPYVVLRTAEVAAIRSRFKVDAEEFVVVLVGKDGDEKFRSRKPISVLKLDALVDSMPIGRRESKARAAPTP